MCRVKQHFKKHWKCPFNHFFPPSKQNLQAFACAALAEAGQVSEDSSNLHEPEHTPVRVLPSARARWPTAKSVL